MGDRVSISFKKGNEGSVVLFSHWGGMGFVEAAREYAAMLPRGSTLTPLDRHEPRTVMVDFIRHMTQKLVAVTGDLYLGATPADVDNSDNGHHVILV